MLLLEPQINQIQGPGLDQPLDQGPNVNVNINMNMNMENAGRPPLTVDGLSSPSDQLSSAAASPGSTEMDVDYHTWLENGIDAAISELPFLNGRGEAVKIVSQTLPYPRASDKSVTLPTHDSVFSAMVQAVQNHMQQGQSPYINITHAVPEQFSLSNLPTSPPSTPLSAGEDYFNSTIFSNAAVVSTYHDFRGPVLGIQESHWPMPVVPPHTVQLSVLERYLPPSSSQEHKDLFSSSRPSYLVDRICELSPNGGSLLFIYPTKRGGSTFKSQYLGPILDPLLRQLVVVNELSADVSRSLGRLASVSQMDDFETMKSNLSQLCEDLSAQSANFSVVDARKGNAHLDRNLWTEWYIHQEKARMKEVLSLYWQNGRRLPINKTSTSSNMFLADKEVTSAMLLGDILDGIRRRPYGEENEHQDGIELGVFVIRRSQ